jgi:aspartyl-tRNA(Asn)/glutamyl-tRNA(Gln) amidotransferase subunit A
MMPEATAYHMDYLRDSPEMFSSIDVLLAPTLVAAAPSLSIPAAFTADGLPLGVQIIGKPFAEPELLQFGYALEQTTDVFGRIAPIVAKAAQ